MNLADMRADYQRNRLRREDLKSDPIEQFQLWLEEACRAWCHGTDRDEPGNRWE
jgi:pyridoxamine 5'-phosphate oxidase